MLYLLVPSAWTSILSATSGSFRNRTMVAKMIRISEREFDQVVQDALDLVPAEFTPYLENVMIEVCDRPTRDMLAENGLEGDAEAETELLGLYIGTPLEDRGIDSPQVLMPDRILVFRRNLCEMCESREELLDEIRVTVLHEIGHHFGLDEDRLEELGYD